VIVAVWLELLPTCTFPKLTLEGLAPSAPAVAPVPVSTIAKGLAEAEVESAMVPLAAVEDCGAKVTLKVAL
jgi:hypothetical protein